MYGPPGCGKSALFFAAFPDAFGFGSEKGFATATHFLSFPFAHYRGEKGEVLTVYDLLTALDHYASTGRKRFLIDDFSMMLKRTMLKIKFRFSGWAIWDELARVMIELDNLIEARRLTVGFTMWYDGPSVKNGERLPGRPMTPSREATGIVLGVMSTVLGFYEDPERMGLGASKTNPMGWQWTISGQPTSTRTGKDRFHVCGINYPPSLRALLREAGQRTADRKVVGGAEPTFFRMPDPPGIPHFDSFVMNRGVPGVLGRREAYGDALIETFRPGQILTIEDHNDFVRETVGQLRAGNVTNIPRNQIQWLVREALYSAEIRMRQDDALVDDLLLREFIPEVAATAASDSAVAFAIGDDKKTADKKTDDKKTESEAAKTTSKYGAEDAKERPEIASNFAL